MKFRSKDIISAIAGSFGYRLEPIRKPAKVSLDAGSLSPDYLPSEPFAAQAQLMAHLGHGAPIVFDVGGNKGDTVEDYRKRMPRSIVHCFEPFPEMIEVLQQRFGGDDSVCVVPKAVSTEIGTTTFFVNHAHATNSLLPRPNDEQRFYPKSGEASGEIEVDTVDLDSYCKQQGIERINLLKLDIQGGELMAIGGAESLLSQHRVDVVYSEIQFVPLYEGAAQFDGVWAKLREHGYSLVDVYDLHRSAGGQILYGDALFVSPDCKKRVMEHYRVDK